MTAAPVSAPVAELPARPAAPVRPLLSAYRVRKGHPCGSVYLFLRCGDSPAANRAAVRRSWADQPCSGHPAAAAPRLLALARGLLRAFLWSADPGAALALVGGGGGASRLLFFRSRARRAGLRRRPVVPACLRACPWPLLGLRCLARDLGPGVCGGPRRGPSPCAVPRPSSPPFGRAGRGARVACGSGCDGLLPQGLPRGAPVGGRALDAPPPRRAVFRPAHCVPGRCLRLAAPGLPARPHLLALPAPPGWPRLAGCCLPAWPPARGPAPCAGLRFWPGADPRRARPRHQKLCVCACACAHARARLRVSRAYARACACARALACSRLLARLLARARARAPARPLALALTIARALAHALAARA